MGAVIHTLNPRLFPEELAYIVDDAQDKVIVVDESLLEVFETFRAARDFAHIIVVTHEGEAPAGTLDYESLVAGGEPLEWPTLDERQRGGDVLHLGHDRPAQGRRVLAPRAGAALAGCRPARSAVRIGKGHNPSGRPDVPRKRLGTAVCRGARRSGSGLPGSTPGRRERARPVRRRTRHDGSGRAHRVDGHAGIARRRTHAVGPVGPGSVDRRWSGGAAVDVRGVRPPRPDRRPSLGNDRDRAAGLGLPAAAPTSTRAMPTSSTATAVARASPARSSRSRARDDEGQFIAWDDAATGELEVRGPWVAASYHRGRGADSFTADGWFKTGDVVRIDAHGCIRICDRSKDLVKSGGEWISSVDLENRLMSHPAVAQAAVIAVPDDRWGERPLAVVSLCAGAEASPDELREHLAQEFAKWQLPDRFEFVAAIPCTATGKFKKTAAARPVRVSLTHPVATTQHSKETEK